MEAITRGLDSSCTAGGITPGEPLLDGTILVAEGEIDTPAYAGHVQVTIDEEWHGLLDLAVAHDEDPEFDWLRHVLADDEAFRTAVILLLQDQGKLPPGNGFKLWRAELGMQSDGLAVFESLCRHDRDVDRAAACLWGATDGELGEAVRDLFGVSDE